MYAIGTKRTSLVALHMSAIGGEADIGQAEFRDFALQEYARWGGIIRDAGIKIN